MSKKITLQQINDAAKAINVPTAALQAVMQVECKGSGFNADGTPVILFERHVFRKQLIANGKSAIAAKAMKERPDLCNTTAGGYGLFSAQHGRLNAATLYDRTSALESASWGLGQIMGYWWKDLGYASIQDFVNAMYKDEASQLEAMCRYIKKNGLDNYLRKLDWAGFALRYNGQNYKANQYDVKLAAAYKGLV
ncbi:N-acetylmuramidase family protein [Acinetobacter sp. MD2(2019)]|uniref:N-acetylmuramidase family protein n=1 Tax=Acinetobacter sp. MD2(2019) TaxID=2605273 RepID=UPI002D1EB154|nr:N-acetylmuramidase family protein [Acinetobacter sp. MD2(2019)]MEB3753832.1 N-acetylmuramidase family protein [Acinetobacter sp. MD2(2019)]